MASSAGQGAGYVGLAIYLVVAARRVYGSGWLANAAKALGVLVIYLGLWGITTRSAALWVSRTA